MMMYRTFVYGAGKLSIAEVAVEATVDKAIAVLRKRCALWNKLVEIENTYIVRREQKINSLEPSDSIPRKQVLKRQDVKDAIYVLNQERWQAVNEACRTSNLYWANYSEVAKDYESARKHSHLRFHKWDGTGKLTVHYQNGIESHAVFDEMERRFQISPPNERNQTLARIRIDTVGKSPVWFELPIVLHRPLPSGIIRDVSFIRERVGSDFRWKIAILLSVPDVDLKIDKSSVIMTIGWKQIDNGILIAHTDTNELILPNRWLDSTREVERIGSSIHDKRHSAHLKDQLFSERRDLYRKYVNTICLQYAEIQVNDINLQWMISENNGASWNMSAAGLSYFYDILENCARNHGTKIIRKGND